MVCKEPLCCEKLNTNEVLSHIYMACMVTQQKLKIFLKYIRNKTAYSEPMGTKQILLFIETKDSWLAYTLFVKEANFLVYDIKPNKRNTSHVTQISTCTEYHWIVCDCCKKRLQTMKLLIKKIEI